MKKLFTFILFLTAFVSLEAQTNTIWQENWEGNWFFDWYVDNGVWEVGTPTVVGPDSAAFGTKCVGTVINGNYPEIIDTRLIRVNTFTVPAASENPRLRFWSWHSMGSGDYGVVQIKDNGGSWQSVSVNYDAEGSGVWTEGMIDLKSFAEHTLQIAFYFHAQDSYPYGLDNGAGWYLDDIRLITGPIVLNSPEGFENGLGDWWVEEGTWETGNVVVGPDSTHSGNFCAGTNLDGNYSEVCDGTLWTPKFYIPLISNQPRILFWHWFSFGSGDYGQVFIRTENMPWTSISGQFINTGAAWTVYQISLDAYKDSLVQIGFYFHAQDNYPYGNDNGPGWYIDDINLLDIVVPVELISFNAVVLENKIQLNWATATEINNKQFDIERSTDSKTFSIIGTVEGNGTTTEQHEYSFIDKPTQTGKYFYRLKQIDFDGSFEYSQIVEVNFNNIPDKYTLLQNYPNPFNPSTKISWQSPVGSWQTLKVYDVLGNEVATLVNEYKPAGDYEIEFNAANIPSGVYFYRLEAGAFSDTKKFILLK